IAGALARDYGASPTEARAASLGSGGRPGLALAALGDPSYTDRREQVLSLFDAALAAREACAADPGRAVEALRLADALRSCAQAERQRTGDGARSSEGGRPLKNALRELLEAGQAYIRDILVLI